MFVFGYQEGMFEEAERWSGTAEAVLQRMGGHELLRAWQLNNIGAVRGLRGDHEAALLAQQQALALKEKALGRDHPDVGDLRGQHRRRADRAGAQPGGAGARRSARSR